MCLRKSRRPLGLRLLGRNGVSSGEAVEAFLLEPPGDCRIPEAAVGEIGGASMREAAIVDQAGGREFAESVPCRGRCNTGSSEPLAQRFCGEIAASERSGGDCERLGATKLPAKAP